MGIRFRTKNLGAYKVFLDQSLAFAYHYTLVINNEHSLRSHSISIHTLLSNLELKGAIRRRKTYCHA